MSSMKHLTGLKNLTRSDIEYILNVARNLEGDLAAKKSSKILEGQVLATLFYEPSTRTRLSFESAMVRLGGSVISVADAQKTSSAWKGETLPDTIRTVENYADIIALRHFQVGAAETAAQYSRVPILNAGDGSNEHPTQTLLDMLTILKERGTLDGLKIAIVGDLKHTRSTNSLTLGLSNFNVDFTFVSPPDFRTSQWILDILKTKGVPYTQTANLGEAVRDADVVYVSRIQKERLESPEEYDKIAGSYVLNRSVLENASKIVTVMHHLPRVGELAEDVDSYPGAAYFRQTYNGMVVRAALLAIFLDRVPKQYR